MPSSASALGLVRDPDRATGECGATNGPNSATSSTKTSTAAPTAPVPLPREPKRLRHVPTALRHECDDDEVGDDVHGDVDRRDHDRDRLHRPHVADRDRVDELLPDARVVEEVLDDDDPADQVLDVLREDLHRRRERVAKLVPQDDHPLGQPVEPRHLT